MDASIHDGTEGRGEDMVLIHRIDDATRRFWARFYDADIERHASLTNAEKNETNTIC
jgi:hypothetical protein